MGVWWFIYTVWQRAKRQSKVKAERRAHEVKRNTSNKAPAPLRLRKPIFYRHLRLPHLCRRLQRTLFDPHILSLSGTSSASHAHP